jgi:hypothetical protein
MRWRLGDPTLTEKQLRAARQFLTYMRTEDVVLGLDLSQEIPWVWLPREAQDGRCILRWPPGREMPRGPHLEAISLPELSLV